MIQHLQPNTTLQGGKYKIERVLGQGGFGITYMARNTVFDVNVAIKEFFMKDENVRNGCSVTMPNTTKSELFQGQKEKFKKEAKRMFAIKNEHIVAVHDLFEENGTAYYVMDYVNGENLAERLKRTGKPMTEAEVNEILPQILDALKSVHDAGIWHLDLKPANIMVDKSGQVKLIDFGASKQQKGGDTTSTAISYTNGYAPREQMEQNYDKFGPWTDLYALGATLYNLLTAKRPPLPTDIDDDTSEDKHLALPMPNVSDAMRSLVLWLMSANCMQRPTNVNAIFDNEETTIVIPFTPVPPIVPPSPSKNNKWYWTFILIGVIVVVIIGVGGMSIYNSMQRNTANELCDTGKRYYCGDSLNYSEAVKYFRAAAELGYAEAQYFLGKSYMDGTGIDQDYNEAAKWLLKAAEQGNNEAQKEIGICYYYGYGVGQDYNEAVKWFSKALDGGEPEVLYMVGKCRYDGTGLDKDYNAAVMFWNEAAEMDYADAQCSLGYCYEKGHGVSQDYLEAIKWYQKAADLGNANAQYHVGNCYECGYGVGKNFVKAAIWYQKAAEQGHAGAQYSLGRFYWHGYGVNQDLEEAKKWYQKAAEQGHQDAIKALN